MVTITNYHYNIIDYQLFLIVNRHYNSKSISKIYFSLLWLCTVQLKFVYVCG